MRKRDVVVIGASMGGIEALSALVSALPGDLLASILVAQHTSPESPATISEILRTRGALHAVTAEAGMSLEPGRIYVAPPDRHLIITSNGLVGVVLGPRENRARPAIDPLFRSAAVHCRSRVIGVVLSGLLGDGAAGLAAIRACGGLPIVQSPDDAEYAEMPDRALRAVPEATVLPLLEIAPLLARLITEPAPDPPPVPPNLRAEAGFTERPMNQEDWGGIATTPSDFTCPDCGGSLRRIESDDGVPRFRCRVGHAFALETLLEAKRDKLEEALWLAMQTLKERGQMLDTMMDEERTRGRERSATLYESRAAETREHVDHLMEVFSALRR